MKLISPNCFPNVPNVPFVIFFLSLAQLQLIAAATQPPELAAAKHNSCDPILLASTCGRRHIKLHGADWARQEVRYSNSPEHLVFLLLLLLLLNKTLNLVMYHIRTDKMLFYHNLEN